MNLVQIQERLKDMPAPSLMQYANGGNPLVPPYLALAELKRREVMTQSAQSQQAMQQGQQPSVKEQVEQAAGLASLQKQVQAQGLQSLMAQARPQSIPENVPQPERQPESEGVAGLPTGDMYNFADGGIVAFAGDTDGSYVKGDQGSYYQSQLEKLKQFNQDPEVISLQNQREQLLRSGKPVQANAVISRINEIRQQYLQPADIQKMEQSMLEEQRSAVRTPRLPSAQTDLAGVPAGAMPPPASRLAGTLPIPGGGIASGSLALPSGAPSGAMPTGAPQQLGMGAAQPTSGIAAIPGADEAKKMMLEQMRSKPTLEAQAANYEKSKGLFGLAQPYGEERIKRIQEMQAEREKALQDRGVERLMRVLGGGAAGGLGGIGEAYLAAREGERMSDAKFRQKMDELLGGVEEKRRAEATEGMTQGQKRLAEEEKLRLGAAEKIMDVDTKFKLQELQSKAAIGRLSAEEQYILSEIQKGKSYPDIVGKIAEAKAGPRAETAEQQRFKDTYLKVAKVYDEMLVKPEGVSRDDYIRREVERAMGTAPIGGASGAAVPQQAIDYLKKNPNLAAQFDAKYGAGASAKYLGR